MNRTTGWLMVVAALAAGYFAYGWQGVVMAASVVVFWLLLQFGRAMRVMTNAGRSPIGSVRSAVMLHSKLRAGMTMLELVHATRSLGEPVVDQADVWRWTDAGGDAVTVSMPDGLVKTWQLVRNETAPAAAENGTPPASP